MTQDPATPGDTPPGAATPTGSPAVPGPRTAATAVGATTAGPPSTLRELEGLDDVPVGEHVERFTRVHDALRARLDGAPDDAHDDGPDAGPGR